MASGAGQIRRTLSDNLQRVRRTIAEACARSGREPSAVTLVAVTKQVELDVIRHALDLGLLDLGESRAQQLAQRASMLDEQARRRRGVASGFGSAMPAPRWHMIGHLQRNKVKLIMPWAHLTHSLDSLRLAEEISAAAERTDRTMDLLLEVNVSGERSKFGVPVGAVNTLLEQFAALPRIRMRGFMTMAPQSARPEEIRGYFSRLRELFEEMRTASSAGGAFDTLSMGMSNDYEIAVECGATLVRVGSALFEGLTASRGQEDEEHDA